MEQKPGMRSWTHDTEAKIRHVVLARLVALAHFSFIVILILGGPLGRRRRGIVAVHLASVVAAGAINLTGSDCPLTEWEKGLLRRGGRTPYATGIVSHYLVEPIRPEGIDGHTNRVILAAWIAPSAVAYLLWGRERRSGRR
jgi:hypothetical protein